MKVRFFLCLLLLFSSCKNMKEVSNIPFSAHTNSYEKFKIYENELRNGIGDKFIPSFLYNPCLDQENLIYCRLDSHHTLSLRYDLFISLSKEELLSLYKQVNKRRLKKICGEESQIIHEDKSTLEILVLVMGEKGIMGD